MINVKMTPHILIYVYARLFAGFTLNVQARIVLVENVCILIVLSFSGRFFEVYCVVKAYDAQQLGIFTITNATSQCQYFQLRQLLCTFDDISM